MSHSLAGEINSKSFGFEWQLKLCNDHDPTIVDKQVKHSPEFTTHTFGKDIKWCLRIEWYPNLDPNGRSENQISVFLNNSSSLKVETTANFSLIGSNNVKYKDFSSPKQLVKPNQYVGCEKFAELNFLIDPRNDIIRNEKMTISCQITIHRLFPEQSFTRLNEFDDFENLFLSEKFSDLTVISADEKEIHVHKNILAIRSPFFNAMFEHDMLEKIENTVKIENFKYEVLIEVFRFIYSGKVNKLDLLICELLRAAEFFDIQGLKLLCEEAMLSDISKENAIMCLIAADQNNSNNAQEIINFIVENAKNFVKTPEFQSLATSNPDLIYKIMKCMVYKNKSSE